MQRRFLIVLLFSMAAIVGCSSNSYEKIENGIIVKLDSSQIRLQVISADIIRVSATVEKTFPGDTSLMVIPRS